MSTEKTEVKETREKSFLTRVLEFAKSDEKSNTKDNLDTIKKNWKKQLEICKRNVENLKRQRDEKLEDLTEYLKEANVSVGEAFLGVSTGKMSKDKREEYVSAYENKIARAFDKVKNLEAGILTTSVDFDTQVEVQVTAIKKYSEYLKKIGD